MKRSLVTIGWLAVLLSGCTLGPDFAVPPEKTAPKWKNEVALDARVVPSAWWTMFEDAEMERLVELALSHNETLHAAVARVEQARAAAGLSRAVRWPGIDFEAVSERERFSANRPTPNGNGGRAYTSNSHSLALDVSWEIDLWGRLRRSVEAAGAAAEASERDRDAMALAIAGETARNYIALRTTERELEIVREGADLRRRAFDLLAGRARAGVDNDLDTSRAEVELANVEADAHELTRRRGELENALAVLCGESASLFRLETSAKVPKAPEIPGRVPSEALRRRPDVAAAIARLHEASARIGVIEADVYPRLSLTASAGVLSSGLSNLFDASSRTGSMGAGISGPVFQGGAQDERIRAAWAAYDEQFALYRRTVLTAFQEVEDALSNSREIALESEFQARVDVAAARALQLSTGRFDQGLVSYLEVVDAARSQLDARRARVQLDGLRAQTSVRLIEAIGQ